MKKIFILIITILLLFALTFSQTKLGGGAKIGGKGKVGGGGGGGFSVPSSFTWEQVPSTPEFVISIAKVDTKLFAGTRSGVPTEYLGGVYKLESGSWSKVNAGLSARISICSDWPTCTTAPTGGTFTLTYSGQTTNPIAFNASNATIQTELTSLSTIGSGNLVVSDGPLGLSATLTFQGARANDDPTNITMDDSGLTGSTPGGMIRGPRFVSQLFTIPATNTLLATIRNNTTTELFRLTSGSTTWTKPTGVGGAGLIFDYDTDASGNILLVNMITTDNVLRSTNDGASFSVLSTINEGCKTSPDPRPLAIHRAATSIAPDNTIFTTAHDDALHYSTDSGATWSCMDIDDALPIGGMSFIRTNGDGQMMMGGEFGGFFLHTGSWPNINGWTYQDAGYFTGNNETVHDLIKLVNNDLIIHAKRPYRSTDGGTTWSLDDNGLPAGNINNFDSGGTFSVCSHTLTIGSDKKLYIAIVNQTSGWGIYRTTANVIP